VFRAVHFCQTRAEGPARVAEERGDAVASADGCARGGPNRRRPRAGARSPVSAGVLPGSWWDRASAHYDRQLWLERSAVNRALDLFAARPDERLLDVGTGTGEVLRQLARRPIRSHEAIGIDTAAAMLARVGTLPPGWNARGDALSLPFDDRKFQVAVVYVLHVLPPARLPVALTELHRVLRPGGRLVTVTPADPSRGLARAVALGSDALARGGRSRYAGLRAPDPRLLSSRPASVSCERARACAATHRCVCSLNRANRTLIATAWRDN
jgi:SAM-dependent methyltransferase